MSKIFGAVTLALSAALGHWLYGEFKSGNCLQNVEDLKVAYQRHAGDVTRGEMMFALRHAKAYCEASQPELANEVLQVWTKRCRQSGGCA